ncbi:MAG TPA: polysaccharide deacetylase family protein [Blastocatellia bacterium]|nr:polysaccharide deacetylase family protein [Blastocatellia bacterium]
MKEILLRLAWKFGGFAPFRLANRRRALVLTYHRFSADGADRTTSAEMFEWQLHYLTRRYQVVPLSLIADCLAQRRELPSRAVAITIDDGYRDAFEIAFPLLRKYHAPATLFAVTDFTDQKIWLWPDKARFICLHTSSQNSEITLGGEQRRMNLTDHEARLQAADRINDALKLLPTDEREARLSRIATMLKVALPALPPPDYSAATWEQLREMAAAGIEIGSHTVTHPILTTLEPAQLDAELRESRARLTAGLHREVKLFCYPNGDSDRRVRAAAGRAGYQCAATCEPGLIEQNSPLLALPRIHTERDPAHFAQSTSGFELRKNRLRNALRPALSG